MNSADLPGNNRAFFLMLFVFSILLSWALPVHADNPPTVDVTVSPIYAGIGDAVTVTATAKDDYGVRLIYFYNPDSSDFTAVDCSDLLTCTKSATKTVGLMGDNNFCVKALDTANQVSSLVCGTVKASADRLPIIKYFHGTPEEGDTPTVHVEGTVKFEIIAEDDKGVKKISLQDMASGKVDEHECASLKTCIFDINREFSAQGVYKFCAWAQDTTLKESAKACIDVHVVAKYSCDYITLDSAEGKDNVALRLTAKRLHPDVDGLAGYSAQCCKDAGYCNDLKIDALSCRQMPIGGDLPAGEYKVLEWFPDQMPLDDLLAAFQYPQILCTKNSPTNVTLGVIENARYGVVGEVQNLEENTMKYWVAGSSQNTAQFTSAVDQRRFFIAEQLQKEDNETQVTTLVDSQKYSEAINKVMENECDSKDLESGECHFDCLDTKCNPTAPCGSGNCLGCPKKPNCECCPQCHKVESYQECTYQKYESMYGRPYTDYLFCWKVNGLKDTPWFYQK